MFGKKDVEEMKDVADYDDVGNNAESIYAYVEDGSMPRDGSLGPTMLFPAVSSLNRLSVSAGGWPRTASAGVSPPPYELRRPKAVRSRG